MWLQSLTGAPARGNQSIFLSHVDVSLPFLSPLPKNKIKNSRKPCSKKSSLIKETSPVAPLQQEGPVRAGRRSAGGGRAGAGGAGKPLRCGPGRCGPGAGGLGAAV